MHAHFERHVYHRHSHETYSFGVTEDGAQSFSCRGAAHTSAAGMVMAFNPDDPHDGQATDEFGFTYRMIHIGPELVAERARRHQPGARRACRCSPSPCSATRCWPAGCARLHLALLGGATALRRDELLASAAGRSRFAVHRAFVWAYGMAPGDYQRQLRLREARRLIARGRPISAATAQAGFSDQSHLTRWFIRCYGITPGGFQRAAPSASVDHQDAERVPGRVGIDP